MMNKKIRKKSGDELQGFLMWRNRGSVVPAKKGKGSYTRKSKHKNKCGYDVYCLAFSPSQLAVRVRISLSAPFKWQEEN